MSDLVLRSKIHTAILPIQCNVNKEENPKIAASPWDLVIPSKEYRPTATGNMHKKLVKIARVVREICSQTDRHTHIQTSSLLHPRDELRTVTKHPGFRNVLVLLYSQPGLWINEGNSLYIYQKLQT